jgi:prevent-host-death family protein
MNTATITEAKNRLSALIDLVRAGETVVITDRGVPVAHLVGAAGAPGDEDEARISRLERRGGIRRPTRGPLTKAELEDRLLGRPPTGVLDALLEERRDGR